jgi:hypothetical protein
MYQYSQYKTIMIHDREYELYSNGDLFYTNGGLVPRQTMTNGYYFYALRDKDGIQVNISTHRLVATHFIPNPNCYPEVNHIDGDKKNSDYRNLEWCNKSMNMKHAYRLNLKKPVMMMGKDNPESVRVGRFDKSGTLIREYDCINDAAKEVGEWRQNISQACRGIRKTVKGSIWKYL